ncbi:hypothetical protein LCM20_14690 [Halobacillus litoralis]|uniref:hypothetical protein n=1 Tax=Halobacillus litoralis TaxID=45668 RepID=UPI001CD4B081|nr:hypothetical protein [Halobacillus litoralis]MCA0971852.1 hypothetical protein [Halobacillus litoralis]
MEQAVHTSFENLSDPDRNIQYGAFMKLLEITDGEVDWAYDVWDQLVHDLSEGDNHDRSRAAQLLCRLSQSDPDKRMLHDFPKVWEVTKDKKFVTARHSLQSIWRIALGGPEQKDMVIRYLKTRFIEASEEKHSTLIRYDIIDSLRTLYDRTDDEQIKELALDLIEKEDDVKYKKKYKTRWKAFYK